MVKLKIYNTKVEKQDKINVNKKIFDCKINKQLVAQAVRVFLANQRQAGAKTKRRSEVIGSRKKIWPQKGTGRARHGDRYAPIFVGGGIAHGPTGRQNFKLKMPKKMRRRALFSALSSKAQAGEILIVENLEKIEPKTKKMAEFLKNLIKKLNKNKKVEEYKITVVLPEVIENVIRAGRNISNLKFLQAEQLNTYQVLENDILIIAKPSLKIIEKNFLKE